jgi:SAM-dependent methyltransferase
VHARRHAPTLGTGYDNFGRLTRTNVDISGGGDVTDTWAAGDGYEPYIGRWSRSVARRFVPWLGAPEGQRWLDVGCGTGALTAAVLAGARPATIVGIDPSPGFLAYAAEATIDPRVTFRQGDALAIPANEDQFAVAVSGLVLNFVPDPTRALAEMRRVTRPGGLLGVYLWDYGGGMQLIHRFWEVAAECDPGARDLDEARRFPLCRRDALQALFEDGGLERVVTDAIEIPTTFRDFDDYWTPFLGGQGPAPTYVASLPEADRDGLREALRQRLPARADGSIELTARAWAARGTVPG